jgi:hypothetical protein
MAVRKRAPLEPTEDWQQLRLQLDWPEQTRYELIRPVASARPASGRPAPR